MPTASHTRVQKVIPEEVEEVRDPIHTVYRALLVCVLRSWNAQHDISFLFMILIPSHNTEGPRMIF